MYGGASMSGNLIANVTCLKIWGKGNCAVENLHPENPWKQVIVYLYMCIESHPKTGVDLWA